MVGDDELRPALMRFADPVRAAGEPAEALLLLVVRGEIEVATDDAEVAPDDLEEDGET